MKRKNKNYKGFSLIESMFGIFIAGAIFTTFMVLFPKMIVAESVARKTVIATNLAQEGIEKVRNLRDNNLKTGCATAFACSFPSNVNYENNFDPMISSGFLRTTTISGGSDTKTVVSTVSWTMLGIIRSVRITDTLTAWGQAN